MNIGRNDPCPCGSGKKFKKCHLGRENELTPEQLDGLPPEAAKKLAELPEVDYGRCREFIEGLNFKKLTGGEVGIKFVDLKSYLDLGYSDRSAAGDLNRTSAGQMINPIKTQKADPDHVYLAVSPAVSDSTAIHQLAHAMDYLAGSRLNPTFAKPVAMELDAPLEILEHPKEFGYWLTFLANEYGVELDAEDEIVAYLHENGRLLPGPTLASGDMAVIKASIDGILDFIRRHRHEIDRRIKERAGYLAEHAPETDA
jgi:hypothetical protein